MPKTPLVWQAKDFGTAEARHDPYTYVVWSNENSAQLRIVRRELTQGIIVPIEDFSVNVKDIDVAMELAEAFDTLLQPHNDYNPPGHF